jgi:hypothetical protein
MADVPPALGLAFARPWTYVVALASAGAMALLLGWSSGLLAQYPTGWELTASPQELLTLLAIAVLFGLLVPLEIAALTKARNAVGTVGGVAGAVTGILSLSCCAPLLIPSLLSFVGLSGTALVAFNLTVRDYLGPLAILSVALMAGSIVLVSRTLRSACVAPPASAAARQSDS